MNEVTYLDKDRRPKAYLEHIINNILSQITIDILCSSLVWARLRSVCLSKSRFEPLRPLKGKSIPCATLPVQGNSSAPKLAPSSSFHHVRIQGARQINCAGHRTTTDDLGLEGDPKYVLVEKMKAGEARGGKGIRKHIPYGRHDRTDL